MTSTHSDRHAPVARVCLLGHSGAGKSTTAAFIRATASRRSMSCAVVKVAAPLYELQQAFYTRLGQPLPDGQQDQQLLEALAHWIRKRHTRFLVDDFLTRAATVEADVLVNDDVRSYDTDYPILREHGWTAVRITTDDDLRGKRLATQGYVSLSDASTAGVDTVDVDYEIRNDGTLAELETTVAALVEEILPC
ncbi:ATP-binding protein [Nocardia wallacei]|uniref:ATP-binding protein n=1 Tax=Nocardia wallacei TaxID=480035 RepID=UPI002454D7C7|nr:ATP-binding protein [Nocardia wallacei]